MLQLNLFVCIEDCCQYTRNTSRIHNSLIYLTLRVIPITKWTHLAWKLDAIAFASVLIPLIIDITVGKHGTHSWIVPNLLFVEFVKCLYKYSPSFGIKIDSFWSGSQTIVYYCWFNEPGHYIQLSTRSMHFLSSVKTELGKKISWKMNSVYKETNPLFCHLSNSCQCIWQVAILILFLEWKSATSRGNSFVKQIKNIGEIYVKKEWNRRLACL